MGISMKILYNLYIYLFKKFKCANKLVKFRIISIITEQKSREMRKPSHNTVEDFKTIKQILITISFLNFTFQSLWECALCRLRNH